MAVDDDILPTDGVGITLAIAGSGGSHGFASQLLSPLEAQPWARVRVLSVSGPYGQREK